MGIADQLQSRPVWRLRPEILLCANTVKPMHGVVPRVILGEEWWDRTRREAYRSTDYHCIACGVHKFEAKEHQWLEGHEVYQTDYVSGRMTYVETVPLCHFCHNFIHNGRLKELLGKGKITKKKYKMVINHGNKVLRQAGLTRTPYRGPITEWSKWRLILDGVEYPPLYRNYEEWSKHFAEEVEE